MRGQRTKQRGRPLSNASTDRILKAARQALAELGIAGVTVEDVAARAAVSLTTIYRRWPTREHLLRSVVSQVAEEQVPVPDTGSLRSDLLRLNRGLVAAFRTSDMGRILLSAIGEAQRDPAWATVVAEIQRARRASTRLIVERAVTRAEIESDVDADLILDMLVGLLWHRRLVSGEPLTERQIDSAVDLILRGINWQPSHANKGKSKT